MENFKEKKFEIYHGDAPSKEVSENEYRDTLAREIKSKPKESRVNFLELNKGRASFYDKAKDLHEKEKEITKRFKAGELSSIEEGWKEIANERVDTLCELDSKLCECYKITSNFITKREARERVDITEQEYTTIEQKLTDLFNFIENKELSLDLPGCRTPYSMQTHLENAKKSEENWKYRDEIEYAVYEFRDIGFDFKGNFIGAFLFSTKRALNKISAEDAVVILSKKEFSYTTSAEYQYSRIEGLLWESVLGNLNTENFSRLLKVVKGKISNKKIEEFISSNLNSENIDKLLPENILSEFDSPTLLKIITEKTDPSNKRVHDVIRFICENNADFTEISKSLVPLWGEKSLFKGFENRSEMENKFFNENINFHVEKIEKDLPEIRKKIDMFYYQKGWGLQPGLHFDTVRSILEKISDGCDNGLKLENYEDVMKKITEFSRYMSEDYGYAKRDISQLISEVLVKLEKVYNEKPEELTGQGIELFTNDGGGNNIYHNGEYQLSVGSDARFSSNFFNNEKITYLTENIIDSSRVKGDQVRYKVYSFDIATKKLEEIFEIHSWIQEQLLLVSTPEVSQDGSIIFKVYLNGEETMNKIS